MSLKSKMLLVDDNQDNILIYEYLFNKINDLEINSTTSGKKAVHLAEENVFDLILLDIEMPEMDGYETATNIKEISINKNTPIVFITGAPNSKGYPEKGYELGAIDYITKPIDDNQLLNKVNLYLKLSRKEKELKDYSEKLEGLVEERTKGLLNSIEETKAANNFKNEIYSNMSHELRTPLHAIMTFSKRGVKGISELDNEKLLFYFSQIRTSGERMLDLIDDLLDLNKLEWSKQKFNFDKYNIVELTREMIYKFNSSAIYENLEIFLIDCENEILVSMDRTQIGIVIKNLISNAIKFSGDDREIKIGILTDNEKVTWSIEDNGRGVPQEEVDMIFEPFRLSTLTKTKSGGKGLGLSICRGILNVHNSKISVANLEKGCKFSFALNSEM
ncbi:MAG: hypothetical protein COA79_08830 [Planctomycetota bacterium]|nr:MAG: hypothetical protein COA79_08830 [Planctomycetota bacterium]